MKQFYLMILLSICFFTINAQIVNIPDENFKNALLNHNPVIDVNGDGEIQISEAESATSIRVSDRSIQSLIGIESFINIESLDCSRNELLELNLDTLINLRQLICNDNLITILKLNNSPITALSVANNPNLRAIFIQNNSNTILGPDASVFPPLPPVSDFSNCPRLGLICTDDGEEETNFLNDLITLYPNIEITSNCTTDDSSPIVNIPDINFKNALAFTRCVDIDNDGVNDLDVDSNNDGNIQVSEAEAIFNLEVSASEIASLIGIESFINVENLNVLRNNLNDLNLNQNLNLISLRASETNLTSLDLSQNLNLETLFFIRNSALNSIDLTQNIELKNLALTGNNSLNNIDLSQNINLETLGFAGNGATSLNLNNNTKLVSLNCDGGNLINISIDQVDSLETIILNFNELTSLNLGDKPSLRQLEVWNNELTNLDVSQAPNLSNLRCDDNLITELDLTNNPLLTSVLASNNQLTNINLGDSPNLLTLEVGDNLLTSLDLSQAPEFFELFCENNQLTSLDFSNNPKLFEVYCSGNQLRSLDFSQNPELGGFFAQNNQLESINLKTGQMPGEFLQTDYVFNNNPDLRYICANTELFDIIETAIIDNGFNIEDIELNSFCSFVPGGEFFTIQGQNRLDIDNDGCDVNDLVVPNLKFNVIDDNNNEGSIVSDDSGSYSIALQEGTYTITPILENPDYFAVTPSAVTVNFPTDASPFIQDFCITPVGNRNDLEVSIIPINRARPGFDSNYKIIYHNKGNTTLSGSVDLLFQDAILDLLTSVPQYNVQSTNTLSWNYSGLQPFETREIEVSFNLNTPTEVPSVNNGDILTFTATINPVSGDEIENDNVFTLNQTVVGSFDPNDKTCLQGNTVTTEIIGEFIHYLIRFENTGTAEAVNIVVTDIIDTAEFDLNSLEIVDTSHTMMTRINQNNIEFIFENINLPFDDATNDGYIAFKIKLLNTLQEGDTFDNTANIFFDFNPPIITNTEITTIDGTLSVADIGLTEGLIIYPNPSNDIVTISKSNNIQIEKLELYSITGKKIFEVIDVNQININNLNNGVYFLKIITEKGNQTKKIVKN